MTRISRICTAEDELLFTISEIENMVLNESLIYNTAFNDQETQMQFFFI
jgi:hypothetical protein